MYTKIKKKIFREKEYQHSFLLEYLEVLVAHSVVDRDDTRKCFYGKNVLY